MKQLARITLLFFLFSIAFSCFAFAESDDDFDEAAALESIYEMFEEDEETSTETYTGDLSIKQELSDEWINILLMGTDNRSNDTNARTDSMIILSINKNTYKAKMTSIMRDTWAPIHGKGNAKINAANVYGGPNLAMRTVNECFGMNIDKYVLVNFKGFSKIIDALGGIDLTITSGEKKYMNLYLAEYRKSYGSENASDVTSSGRVHVTGAQATAYSRIRYIGSDYQRTQRQRTVLIEMAKKLSETGMQKIIKMLPTFLENVKTNLSAADIIELVTIALQVDLDNEESVTEYRIPVDGTFQSGMFGSIWMIKPDFEANTQLLHEFVYN